MVSLGKILCEQTSKGQVGDFARFARFARNSFGERFTPFVRLLAAFFPASLADGGLCSFARK